MDLPTTHRDAGSECLAHSHHGIFEIVVEPGR
jgi:hypothetical protein